MPDSSFAHLETDRRQRYLGDLLSQDGYSVILAESAPEHSLEASSIPEAAPILVLLPIPVSPALLSRITPRLTPEHTVLGGNLPQDFVQYCAEHHIQTIDYIKSDTVAIRNAVATAEGAVCQAIQASPVNLHDSQALVIGFGKCGEILADKLQGLKCHVSISTRDSAAKAKAVSYGYTLHSTFESYDFLFNTAPALVITPDIIDKLKKDTVIIDIASHPGGCDFNYCIEKEITALHCPGLPGKYAPKTSAQIIYEQLKELLP